MEFLIVCPLVFLAGFVDAIAGGGGLISLPAYLIAGLPVHTAIGTNKLSSGMGTAVATWRFWQKGYIPVKEALAFMGFGNPEFRLPLVGLETHHREELYEVLKQYEVV